MIATEPLAPPDFDVRQPWLGAYTRPWLPQEAHSDQGQPERRPVTARVVARLHQARAGGWPLDPWLGFPQDGCFFSFGRERKPLPIGTLFILWDAGWPFRLTCPSCGGCAWLNEFGGVMGMGGLYRVCTRCARVWYQPMRGFGPIIDLLTVSPLAGTEFQRNGYRLFEAAASPSQRLRRLLGIREEVEPSTAKWLLFSREALSLGRRSRAGGARP